MSEQKTEQETEAKDYSSLEFYANEPGGQEGQGGDYIPKDQPDQPELGADELAFIFELGFGMVAGRRGEHWKIESDEAKSLGLATDRVLQKYLPDLKTGPEVALVLTAGALILPRWVMDKQAQAEAEAKGAEDAD